MRKKLFAVIMSAMMMITFMPAMAFAGTVLDAEPSVNPAQTGWYVSDFKAGPLNDTDWDDPAEFTYDGKDHTVSFKVTQYAEAYNHVTVNYYNLYTKKADGSWSTAVKTTTAPVIKNAGDYCVEAVGTIVKTIRQDTRRHKDVEVVTPWQDDFYVNVTARKVAVQGFGTLVKTKAYDGKGFTLSDKDFTILPILGADGKEVANTGLVAGDTLLTKTITTAADVGVYNINNWNSFNANYVLCDEKGTAYAANGFTYKLVLEIVKADNAAKIASNTLIIKRGSSKAVKFSATFGTAKLAKLSGNTKISVKNGKIVVKKSCKKGTYKIKVKASAAGNNNYASASRVKTLTIKVK